MREDLCMHDGCNCVATWFEEDGDHWHDWIWCDEHAKGRVCLQPLKVAPRGRREEADE